MGLFSDRAAMKRIIILDKIQSQLREMCPLRAYLTARTRRRGCQLCLWEWKSKTNTFEEQLAALQEL
jgi:hypothetical protein